MENSYICVLSNKIKLTPFVSCELFFTGAYNNGSCL